MANRRKGGHPTFLSKAKLRKIISEYLKGESVKSISNRYNIGKSSIRRAVIRFGYSPFNSSDARSTFKTKEQQTVLRTRYENGENSRALAVEFGVSPDSVIRAIRKAGGKVYRRARKYFRRGLRERQIKSTYGVVISDMEKLKRLQKGLCLWCFAPLPDEILDCAIDHVGGVKTRRDKNKSTRVVL